VTAIAATVQAFFTERLAAQRRASPHTVAAYRDTLRMLLGFAAGRTGTVPCRLDVADLDAPVIAAFLDHIEHERGNSIRTRNARFAALRSFLKYATARDPASLPIIQRVLAIPMKRFQRPALSYLSREAAECRLCGRPALSDPSGQAGFAPHLSAHDGHAPVAVRC